MTKELRDDAGMIGTRIKKARESLGLTQQQLADRAGVLQGLIGKLEAGSQQSTKDLAKIAHALGVRAYWLQTGVGPQKEDEEDARKGHRTRVNTVQTYSTGPRQTDAGWSKKEVAEELVPQPPEGFVLYPVIQRDVSAERGWARSDEPAFPVYKAVIPPGLTPDLGGVVKVDSDVMEPTIFQGDSVLIDLTDTIIQHGLVYAMVWRGSLVLRRINLSPGRVIVHHDNPRYADVTFSDDQWERDIDVLGRARVRTGAGGL